MSLDLFGHEVTYPTIAASSLPKGVFNASAGFSDWWTIWTPGHPRKVDKQTCLNRWAKFDCASRSAHIMAYTLWMQTQPDWTKDGGAFIPMPASFLSKRGWLEWVEPKKAPPKHDVLAELRAHVGTKPSADIKAKLLALRNREVV